MSRRERGRPGGMSPSGTHDRIAPFVAPVASDAGAVIRDEADLEAARAVLGAFTDGVPEGGLTLAEIRDRVGGAVPADVLTARLHVYEGLGMLLPIVDRAHVARYIPDPGSFAGLLAVERLVRDGGAVELLTLLNSTLADVRRGYASAGTVAAALTETRLFFGLLANALARLVAYASLAELIGQSRNYDSADCLTTLQTLTVEVRERFAELEPLAYAATVEAQRYNRAVEEGAARILDQGARAGALAYLSAEDYLALAIEGDVDTLAEVFADAVFDPGAVALDPAGILDALDAYGAPRPWRPAGAVGAVRARSRRRGSRCGRCRRGAPSPVPRGAPRRGRRGRDHGPAAGRPVAGDGPARRRVPRRRARPAAPGHRPRRRDRPRRRRPARHLRPPDDAAAPVPPRRRARRVDAGRRR